jgi:hypothetical protein
MMTAILRLETVIDAALFAGRREKVKINYCIIVSWNLVKDVDT